MNKNGIFYIAIFLENELNEKIQLNYQEKNFKFDYELQKYPPLR